FISIKVKGGLNARMTQDAFHGLRILLCPVHQPVGQAVTEVVETPAMPVRDHNPSLLSRRAQMVGAKYRCADRHSATLLYRRKHEILGLSVWRLLAVLASQARAPDGCRFLVRRAAIPQSVEVFEPASQTPRNVGERIQTTSESRKVHQCRGYDKA